MADMAKHASTTDRGLGRARVAAWTVFLSMAGTTMTFQVYHSIEYGRMPWPLATLYGVVPLLISICILEVIAEWRGSPAWAKAAAYAIMGGAMFMSAAATGEVVLHAAPQHWSLLFGLLLDAAALLTVHFLLSGSPAVSRAQAEAEAARRAELDEAKAQTEATRAALAESEKALADAERQAAEAEANAETFARKLAANSGSKGRRNAGARKGANSGRPAPATAVPKDVDARAEALRILTENPDISGRELGEKCGRGERWGQMRKQELTGHVAGGEASAQ